LFANNYSPFISKQSIETFQKLKNKAIRRKKTEKQKKRIFSLVQIWLFTPAPTLKVQWMLICVNSCQRERTDVCYVIVAKEEKVKFPAYRALRDSVSYNFFKN
jgi:hypothetical protein